MKGIFEKAWSVCVEEYRQGHVNSECTLQALLFAELRNELRIHAPDDRVLCEPRLESEKYGTTCPDIVVISPYGISAIAELKFEPHYHPKYKGDIAKLADYAKDEKLHEILLDPATGKFSDKRHGFANDCLFVFGVIGRHNSEAIDEETLLTRFDREVDRNGIQFLPLIHKVG